MATPDYSTWLPKADAATAIGVSTKTIEQLTKDGKLEQARYKRPDGGPELAVYNPDDVARIASERHPARPAFVLPAVTTPANGNGRHSPSATALATAERGAAGAFDVRAFLESLIAAAISQSAETSQSSQRSPPAPWMTVAEIARAWRWTRADVRALMADEKLGEVFHERRGRHVVRRTAVEAFAAGRRDLEQP